jgi:maltose/maltodextrin transport system substrate-binding protein/arabinogalactan oligomer/maltooligosaccharide transport system substrate-binding protein
MFRKSFIAFVLLALVMSVAGSVFAQDELVIWADETRAPVLEALGAEFEAEFGIAVKVQQLGFGDIRDGFKTAAPAGEGPDIIIGAHDWLGELVVNGLLEPMDLGELAELFVPAALDAFTFDGILYGLPYATENVAFLYNTELVETPPTTWDEVRTLSEEIVASGAAKYGYIRQDGDPYHFFPIQTAFGGYVFGRDEAGNYLADDLGIDSEGAIAAAQWYQGMVEAGLQPDGVDYDVMHNLFESGDAAMIITGPWALERIRNSGVPYAATVFPAGPAGAGKPFFGAQGFMISAYSDNKELAVAFLTEFVLSEDIEVTTDAGTGTPMVLLGLSRPSAFLPALELSEDPDFPSFAEAGAEALPMPAIPAMGSVWTAWDQALGAINDKAATAEDAFSQAAEQIRTLIAGS